MNTNHTAFPDMANMSDRQLTLLLLYETIDLKAELRAVSSLLLQVHSNVVGTAQFDAIADKAQKDAIDQMISHATDMLRRDAGPSHN